jgi:hypothetical protein
MHTNATQTNLFASFFFVFTTQVSELHKEAVSWFETQQAALKKQEGGEGGALAAASSGSPAMPAKVLVVAVAMVVVGMPFCCKDALL